MEQEINGKFQKINEEDSEIIKILESKGTVFAVKSYMDKYDSGVMDAKEAVKTIQNRYNVKRKDLYIPDEEEMLLYIEQMVAQYKETGEYADLDEFDNWYMEVSGCDTEQTTNAIGDSIDKYIEINGLEGKTIYGTKKAGCFSIILIAIISTLSALCLL